VIYFEDNRWNETCFRPSNFFHINDCTANDLSDYHIHNFPQILYVFNGTFTHMIDDVDYVQTTGDLLILPPYFSHAMDTRSEPVSWIFVNFADNFLDMFPEGKEKDELFNLVCLRPLTYKLNNVTPFIHFEGDSREKLEVILKELSDEYSKNSEKSPAYLRAKLVQLLTFISEQHNAVSPEADRSVYLNYRSAIKKALDYIDGHFSEPINRDDICRIAHMSRSSFTYVFKQIVGQTLLEYITSLRIRHAEQLLQANKLSITEIGEKCGFVSTPYFSQTFKDHTGFSPREYAKLIRSPE